MPTTEEFRQLAGATVGCLCPACVPEGIRPNTTTTCKDGARIYLFQDSMRVPCPHVVAEQDWSGTQLTQLGIALSLNDDHQRECRGWVPSEDGWVWGPAVRVAMVQSGMMESRWAERLGLAWMSGRDAFLAMLREAVLSIEGVELG